MTIDNLSSCNLDTVLKVVSKRRGAQSMTGDRIMGYVVVRGCFLSLYGDGLCPSQENFRIFALTNGAFWFIFRTNFSCHLKGLKSKFGGLETS